MPLIANCNWTKWFSVYFYISISHNFSVWFMPYFPRRAAQNNILSDCKSHVSRTFFWLSSPIPGVPWSSQSQLLFSAPPVSLLVSQRLLQELLIVISVISLFIIICSNSSSMYLPTLSARSRVQQKVNF